MNINNTYLLEAMPSADFIKELQTLASKYNASFMPVKDASTIFTFNCGSTFNGSAGADTKLGVHQLLAREISNTQLVRFRTEETSVGDALIGSLTVLNIPIE